MESELEQLIREQRSDMGSIVYPEFPNMLRLDWQDEEGGRLGDRLDTEGELAGLFPLRLECPVHGVRDMSPTKWGRCRACERERCRARYEPKTALGRYWRAKREEQERR